MLAKVSCGFHKPNKQTILPHDQVKKLYEKLKISKLRGLGGKLGENVIQDLNCETVIGKYFYIKIKVIKIICIFTGWTVG